MSEITLTGWDVLDEARAMLRAAVAGVPRTAGSGRRRARSGTSPRCCSTPRWTSGRGRPRWPGRRCPARTRSRPRGSSDGAAGVRRRRAGRVRSGLDGDRPGLRAVPTPLPQGRCRLRPRPGPPPWTPRSTPGTSRWRPARARRSPRNWPGADPGCAEHREPLRQYGAYARRWSLRRAPTTTPSLCYLGRRPPGRRLASYRGSLSMGRRDLGGWLGGAVEVGGGWRRGLRRAGRRGGGRTGAAGGFSGCCRAGRSR